MTTFGLTGGIGMGKTTAGNLLAKSGVEVVDTDELARKLVEPGQPALEEIRTSFGDAMISAAGSLRRAELARLVFADSAARKRLEAILHPRIREAWLTQIQAWRAEDRPAAVVVIPLLFETNAAAHFDTTICIACSTETQKKRLMARGWSTEQIAARVGAQLPIIKKMEMADYVVWTEGNELVLAEQLKRIIN